jgi:hypothetical protein
MGQCLSACPEGSYTNLSDNSCPLCHSKVKLIKLLHFLTIFNLNSVQFVMARPIISVKHVLKIII